MPYPTLPASRRSFGLLLLVLGIYAPAAAAPTSATGTLSGVVSNAATGNLLPGATVRLPALGITARADDTGRYLVREVAAGDHEIIATYAGLEALTARVTVNRLWQQFFGAGLVESAGDFGVTGSRPSHPELLDWLALRLRDSGWDQRAMMRLMVTSATYRQSAAATPALLEKDPANRLLARGARFRGDAEVVRDSALTIAGLLHPRVGGPSIFPPVPENVLAYNYVKPTYWEPPTGPERYRRSLYLFRKRSMPDPMLSAFDAPNGDAACARRAPQTQ